VDTSSTPSTRHHDVRQLLPTMRALLATFAVLTAMAVVALFVLAEDTDRLFAWTIQPPLTAAFLGAGYAAGFVLVVLSFRDPVWAHTRVPVLTILAFVVLTLIATLVHIDRFHFQEEFAGLPFVARAAAWFWLGVYVLVPVLMLVALAPQERAPGRDPEPRHPVPGLLRTALAVESAVLLAVGIALYSAPSTAASLWPWPLTPLTARVVAAWLIAFGVAAAAALVERDLDRVAAGAVAYVVFGVLALLALPRYGGVGDWSSAAGIGYLVLLVSVIPVGVAGSLLAARARRRPAGGATPAEATPAG
jgi:hypothetical protein